LRGTRFRRNEAEPPRRVRFSLKQRYSASPGLRPAQNGPWALCPAPFPFAIGPRCFAIELLRPSGASLSWDRPGHDRLALAGPSVASDTPEPSWSSRPILLILQNGPGQDGLTSG